MFQPRLWALVLNYPPQLQINYDRNLGNLIVHVLQARNLAPRDNDSYSDPFVKVYLLPGRGWAAALFRVSQNVRSVSPFLLLCLSGCLSPLFFLTLYPLLSLELTNWFRLYERMRTDTMTWGSHTGLPFIQWVSYREETQSQTFQTPPFTQTRCIRWLCASPYLGLAPLCGGTGLRFLSRSAVSTHVWKAKERIDNTFSRSVTVSALR